MRRLTKAMATSLFAVAVIVGVGSPAQAADDPRFPMIPGAPNWYTAAPEAPYAFDDVTMAEQRVIQDDDEWHASAWWHGPNGGAPAAGEPDIIIETIRKGEGETGETDPNLIILSLNAAFPELTDSLGTEFASGLAIPDSNAGALPTLTFPGDGIVVVQRPPRDCTMANDQKDQDRFVANFAMLGQNQHKYLVNLTVEYGWRTWKETCGSFVGAQAPVASEPAKKTEPAKKVKEGERAEEAKKAAETEEVVDEETADGQTDASSNDAVTWTVIGLVVVSLVVIVLLRFRRKRTHSNDGTLNETGGRTLASEFSRHGRHESGQ